MLTRLPGWISNRVDKPRTPEADFASVSGVLFVFGVSKRSHRTRSQHLADAVQRGFGKHPNKHFEFRAAQLDSKIVSWYQLTLLAKLPRSMFYYYLHPLKSQRSTKWWVEQETLSIFHKNKKRSGYQRIKLKPNDMSPLQYRIQNVQVS